MMRATALCAIDNGASNCIECMHAADRPNGASKYTAYYR